MPLKSSPTRTQSSVSPFSKKNLTIHLTCGAVVIPKQNSIFSLVTPFYSTLTLSHGPRTPLPLPDVAGTSETTVLDKPHLEFQLYGNQFRFRSAERAGRKFKHKETIEL